MCCMERGYFPDLRAAGALDMQLFISSPSGGSAGMQLADVSRRNHGCGTFGFDIAAACSVPATA